MRLEHLLSGEGYLNDSISVGGHAPLLLLVCLLGGLAQLARALAWHARGHRFDPDILHFGNSEVVLRNLP